jgi:hypothetical protein
MKLFTAPDIYRVAKAADVESIRDAGIIAFCILMLTVELEEYVRYLRPDDPLVLKSDPVFFGLRLLRYRAELQQWRDAHPQEMKFANEISKSHDMVTAISYIIENVDKLARLIPH